MIIALMAAGVLGGASAVGCAVVLELPSMLILAAYPGGGTIAVFAVAAALALPLSHSVRLRASRQG